MDLESFIQPELLALVPALYMIGIFLKRSTKFPDGKIPVVLGAVSMVLCTLYTFSTVPVANVQEIVRALFVSLTQGILCAGTAVYTNQLIKQGRSSGPDDTTPQK